MTRDLWSMLGCFAFFAGMVLVAVSATYVHRNRRRNRLFRILETIRCYLANEDPE